ncbi:MAG: pentapeptide repeat-containing protein [Candidatus Aenigmarchaeota archaeon]|nr:pentapeptide repeat-containing protein [Candidatus Aenigmarchaeota archaeon]
MLSSEFLECLAQGQREFSDIRLQYADLSGRHFVGLTFRNCKFYFVILRHCNFKDVVFEGCEFFFTSFGDSKFESAEFRRCQLDYSGFGDAIVENSRMVDTRLSWHNFIDAKIGGLELMNCTEFMVLRNISELTPKIIESGLRSLQPIISQLDFDMQEKVKAIMNAFAQQHGLELPDISNKTQRNAYGELQGSHAKGYQLLDAFVDTAIRIYGEKNLYQSKNIYDINQNIAKKDPRDRRLP